MSETTDTQALADSISVHVKTMLDLNLEIAARAKREQLTLYSSLDKPTEEAQEPNK